MAAPPLRGRPKTRRGASGPTLASSRSWCGRRTLNKAPLPNSTGGSGLGLRVVRIAQIVFADRRTLPARFCAGRLTELVGRDFQLNGCSATSVAAGPVARRNFHLRALPERTRVSVRASIETTDNLCGLATAEGSERVRSQRSVEQEIRLNGFHSRANCCASLICSGFICLATSSRYFISL